MWDVGCGAGLLSLVAARAGARVFASDVDDELTALAARNAALNGLAIDVARGDLLAAANADDRFDAIVFNAPLLRAPLATADEAPRYSVAAGGEALALRFLDGAFAHLAGDGVILLHAQLTPAVDAALEDISRRARVICVRFAEAPDGTPHALTEIATGQAPLRRDARVPLSVACRHLSREIFAALAPDARAPEKTFAPDVTPLPAPWLERRTSERYDGGAKKTLDVTFGGAHLPPEELALLDRLGGASLGTLALSSLDRERLESLVARALVILR